MGDAPSKKPGNAPAPPALPHFHPRPVLHHLHRNFPPSIILTQRIHPLNHFRRYAALYPDRVLNRSIHHNFHPRVISSTFHTYPLARLTKRLPYSAFRTAPLTVIPTYAALRVVLCIRQDTFHIRLYPSHFRRAVLCTTNSVAISLHVLQNPTKLLPKVTLTVPGVYRPLLRILPCDSRFFLRSLRVSNARKLPVFTSNLSPGNASWLVHTIVF